MLRCEYRDSPLTGMLVLSCLAHPTSFRVDPLGQQPPSFQPEFVFVSHSRFLLGLLYHQFPPESCLPRIFTLTSIRTFKTLAYLWPR
jgi:hypothetical protein